MTELKRHPKYQWIWLNENGEVWSSLTKIPGRGNQRFDCGQPDHKLQPFQFKGRGMNKPYYVVKLMHQSFRKVVKVHRLMADIFFPDAEQVQFIDGDISNLKLSNLKPISSVENAVNQKRPNKHGYTGVCYMEKRKKWKVMLRLGGRSTCVGTTMRASRIPEFVAKRQAIIDHYLKTGKINKNL